jgi:Family of unknown function (DUF5689)
MKKILVFALPLLLAALPTRADLLFSDNLNYQNGVIETDGLWYANSPAIPHQDAFIVNNLLILNETNYDAVAAPTNNFTPAGSVVFASFNINVSTLPSKTGGYIADFKDSTNDYICHVFIATTNTVIPGTYRLAIANAANSITASGVGFFPLDLATDTTYQVVFSYDANNALAQLWVNPAASGDASVYANDDVTNSAQLSIAISQITFSQYANQGVAAIGNILVGDTFDDVTNAPQAPFIGVQPQDTNTYSNDSVTLYVLTSGTGQLNYQWLSNNVPISDDGVTVIGSSSNVLTLNNLQNTADYSVVVSNAIDYITSSNAIVTVISTPTPPFFTKQPYGATNTLFSSIILSAQANGSGPLYYQWYFEPTNILSSGFTALPGQTNSVLYLDNLAYTNTGLYYITATGADGSTNSSTNSVLVTPPVNVTIAYLHTLMQTNNSGSYNLALGQYVTVQGIVTSFAPFSSATATYGEYYIEDPNGSGIYVYLGGQGSNSVPSVGSLVSVTGPCQAYSGQLEIDPTVGTVVGGVTNGITILSTNNPLPASQLINFSLMATNSLGAYGIQIQDSLVTVTNVYIYTNNSGVLASGNFATNKATTLYMTTQPYAPGVTNLTLYIYASNGEATNFWGQLIPGHAYEITGVMGQYKSTAELYPTRYVDIVTNLPTPFAVSISKTNGYPQLTWPTVTGSTYSVYSATNLLGPWIQTFGLSYYPSIGTYTTINAANAQFYKVSSP